jgi:hypothetical protein
MEASEVLKEAWVAVEEADLPDEIKAIAFREAVRLLSPGDSASWPAHGVAPVGKQGTGGPSKGRGDQVRGGEDGQVPVTEAEIYDRVVAQTGADRGKLEQVVHLDDGDIRVSIPGIKLGKSTAERARSVAQLLAITRGFGLEESETPLEVVRKECERIKVYDSPNFSSQIRALDGYVVTGSGRSRRLRPKSPAIEAFPALIEGLVGDS